MLLIAHWSTNYIIALRTDVAEQVKASEEAVKLIEANPIAKVIINFMENHPDWSGSATDLFHELNDVAESLMIDTKDRRYPNDPRWLWRRLKEVKPNLAAIGIFIEKNDTDRAHGRFINITKEQKNNGNGPLKHPKNDVNVVMLSEGQNDIKDINDINILDLSEEEQEKRTKEYFDEMD